jgi:hypothetical protein
MQTLALTLAALTLATPLVAQSPITPRPARVWTPTPALSYPAQDTIPGATTGIGTGVIVGGLVGAIAGYTIAGYCGIGDAPCGNARLLGALLGAIPGAMIGSVFEGDQPPAPPPER